MVSGSDRDPPIRTKDDARRRLGVVKEFAIYTALRLAMFMVCYAVFAAVYVAIFGKTGALVWPFLAAIVVSSLLSLKYLAPHRERFASVVQARAERATARYEEMRSKEDVD
jgi:fatty acid desaturase